MQSAELIKIRQKIFGNCMHIDYRNNDKECRCQTIDWNINDIYDKNCCTCGHSYAFHKQLETMTNSISHQRFQTYQHQ